MAANASTAKYFAFGISRDPSWSQKALKKHQPPAPTSFGCNKPSTPEGLRKRPKDIKRARAISLCSASSTSDAVPRRRLSNDCRPALGAERFISDHNAAIHSSESSSSS